MCVREGGREGGREGEGERERERERERAQGVPNTTAFSKLQSLLGLTNKTSKDLVTRACGQAMNGSYKIWCLRNLLEPS